MGSSNSKMQTPHRWFRFVSATQRTLLFCPRCKMDMLEQLSEEDTRRGAS